MSTRQPTVFTPVVSTTRPRLEVVTRHLLSPRRADALVEQQTSLASLGTAQWVQTVLVDPSRAGVPASHVRLRSLEPWGDYVWILDDDDLCRASCLPFLTGDDDLYIFRVRSDELDDLFPLDVDWARRRTDHGLLSPSNLVVRRDLWMRIRESWGEWYSGDYAYMLAALHLCQRAEWIDVVIAEIASSSHGQA